MAAASNDGPVLAERGPDAVLEDPDAGAKAASGGAVRVGLQGVSLLLVLISTAVITRQLGAVGFGQYATVLALTSLISGVTDFGLASVGVGEWLRTDRDARRRLLADLVVARLAVTLGVAVLAVAFTVVAGYARPVVVGSAVGMAAVTVNALSSVLSVPLVAQLRWKTIGAVEVAATGTQMVLQVSLALAGAGVVVLICTLLMSAAVALGSTVALVRRQLVRPTWSVRRPLRLLRESVVFGVASAVSIVYLRSTMLIVPLTAPAAVTGSFAIGLRAIESLTIIPLLLTGALFPILVHAAINDRARFAHGFDVLWRSSATVGALIGSAAIGAAPLATLAISGEHDRLATETMVVFSCGLATLFMSSSTMWMLLAEKAYSSVLKINAVALPVNLGLTVLCIDRLGVQWAGLGLVVCEFGITAAGNRVASTRLGVPGRGRLRQGLLASLAVLAAVGAFVLVRPYGLLPPLAAAPAACLLVLLATRAIPNELWALVRNRLPLKPRTT